MFQDSITIENRHKRFIKTISETKVVFSLKSKKGYATSSSTMYEDENGYAFGLLCFWAEEVRAKHCAKDEWRKYKVVRIPLAEFLENWCIGMAKEGLLVGTQFDLNLFGYEADPLELILDVIAELCTIGSNFRFRNFESIEDLENHVKEIS